MNQTEIDSLALASPDLELDVGVQWLAANDAAATHRHPGPARDFLPFQRVYC